MATYYAYQCKKCKQFYMSMSAAHPKCAYCRSGMAELKKEDRPKAITLFVQQQNALRYMKNKGVA